MRSWLTDRRWRASYRRTVRHAFDRVPLYRELWAMDGRTEPVLVPDRTGRLDGALTVQQALRRAIDLVPSGEEPAEPDLGRGLRTALAGAGQRVRGSRLVSLDGPLSELVDEVGAALNRGERVLAVGEFQQLDELTLAFPDHPGLRTAGRHQLDDPTGEPGAVLHGGPLGYLGWLGNCGQRHLDWPRVYARPTAGGLAITVLGRQPPLLVDVLAGGGVPGEVMRCSRHGTPVVRLAGPITDNAR